MGRIIVRIYVVKVGKKEGGFVGPELCIAQVVSGSVFVVLSRSCLFLEEVY